MNIVLGNDWIPDGTKPLPKTKSTDILARPVSQEMFQVLIPDMKL